MAEDTERGKEKARYSRSRRRFQFFNSFTVTGNRTRIRVPGCFSPNVSTRFRCPRALVYLANHNEDDGPKTSTPFLTTLSVV